MIIPSVGRKVWFFRNDTQRDPIDATIIKVEGPGTQSAVNLLVVDPDSGETSIERRVLVGDDKTDIPHYRWMPYQIGQAKTAALTSRP